jgi:cytidylate kinase
METGTLIAIFSTGLVIIGAMISLFLWMRSEANADRRYFQEVQREDRKDILNLMRSIEMEIKDFHHRLCAIEEKKQ